MWLTVTEKADLFNRRQVETVKLIAINSWNILVWPSVAGKTEEMTGVLLQNIDVMWTTSEPSINSTGVLGLQAALKAAYLHDVLQGGGTR